MIDSLLDYQKPHRAAIVIQSAYRMAMAKIKRRRMKREIVPRRIESFRDLCNNESRYVNNLALLVSQYITPLRASQEKQLRQIADDSLTSIFGNIETILSVHQTILQTLLELMDRDSWPKIEGLGKLMQFVSHHLRVYGPYVNNFKVSIDTLSTCESSSKKYIIILFFFFFIICLFFSFSSSSFFLLFSRRRLTTKT